MKEKLKIKDSTDNEGFGKLVINLRSDDETRRNPLCPECKEEIRPVSNDFERRFVCGCDELKKFTFEEKKETIELFKND